MSFRTINFVASSRAWKEFSSPLALDIIIIDELWADNLFAKINYQSKDIQGNASHISFEVPKLWKEIGSSLNFMEFEIYKAIF